MRVYGFLYSISKNSVKWSGSRGKFLLNKDKHELIGKCTTWAFVCSFEIHSTYQDSHLQIKICKGGSEMGRWVVGLYWHATNWLGPISFNFRQFSGKNGQNNRLAPHLGNPGSVTDLCSLYNLIQCPVNYVRKPTRMCFMCHRNIKLIQHSCRQQHLKLSNLCACAIIVFRSLYKLPHKTDIKTTVLF